MSTYDPVGTECKGHQPGTDTLMRVSGEIYGTTTDGQTFVCRNISGSTKKSFHAEGRAGDSSGHPGPMRALAEAFVTHWAGLGVQEVIYDRVRYSTETGVMAAKPFTGSDPHTSHVHWSLTWDAAENLTEAKIRAVLLGEPEPEPDMPLNDADLEAIRKIVDEVVKDRVGDLGQDTAGKTIRRTVANAIRVIKPKP